MALFQFITLGVPGITLVPLSPRCPVWPGGPWAPSSPLAPLMPLMPGIPGVQSSPNCPGHLWLRHGHPGHHDLLPQEKTRGSKLARHTRDTTITERRTLLNTRKRILNKYEKLCNYVDTKEGKTMTRRISFSSIKSFLKL